MPMTCSQLAQCLLVATCFLFVNTVTAQLRISEPMESGTPVRQASLNSPVDESSLTNNNDTKATHIRIGVRILFVDPETRGTIYSQLLPPESIRQTVTSPVQPPIENLASPRSALQCRQHLATYSRCTTAIVDDAAAQKILELVDTSPLSDLTETPSISILDGKTGDLNQAIQRPFVVDFEMEQGEAKPIIKTLEDGVRVRILAKLVQADEPAHSAIQVTAEVIANQILGVKSDQVFGLGDEIFEIQVPLSASQQVLVSEQLLPGQSILVDPHVTRQESIVRDEEVSMLGRIPYFGHRFRDAITLTTVDRKVLVFLRPAIVPR